MTTCGFVVGIGCIHLATYVVSLFVLVVSTWQHIWLRCWCWLYPPDNKSGCAVGVDCIHLTTHIWLRCWCWLTTVSRCGVGVGCIHLTTYLLTLLVLIDYCIWLRCWCWLYPPDNILLRCRCWMYQPDNSSGCAVGVGCTHLTTHLVALLVLVDYCIWLRCWLYPPDNPSGCAVGVGCIHLTTHLVACWLYPPDNTSGCTVSVG